MYPANRAVLKNDSILDFELLGNACQVIINLLLKLSDVVRMNVDQLAELCACSELHIRAQLKNFLHHRRHKELVGGKVPNPVAFLGSGGRDHVALFGLPQLILSAPLRVDIADRAGDTDWLPIRITNAQSACAHPMPVAVITLNSILDRV